MINVKIGIILSGGLSTRMINDKSYLNIDNHKSISIQLAKYIILLLYRLKLNTIYISDNNKFNISQKKCRNLHSVIDLIPNGGPISGIHSAFKSILSKKYNKISMYSNFNAIVIPIDMPILTINILEMLIKVHKNDITKYNNYQFPFVISINKKNNDALSAISLKASKSLKSLKSLENYVKVNTISKHSLNKSVFFNVNRKNNWIKFNDHLKDM